MGQTLSVPATEKHRKGGEDERFAYGLCEMQGWRISMEDAHAMELKLESEKEKTNAYFAVYDGHGGGTVARFSGENVHKRLLREDEYHESNWGTAMKKAFLGTDEDIRADPAFFRDPSGCTAVAALLTHDGKIVVANAGDSRSVMSIKGEAKPLSFDHKPMNETEMTRIHKAGGFVDYGRVNGNLSLSRAIGDFQFKTNHSLPPEEQIVTADPDITEHVIGDEDEFLVLACDGIWDCLTSQQVISIVRAQIAQRKSLTDICEFICDHCLAPDTSSGAGVGCDNMTVLIVALLNGRTKEEWYNWIAERVENGHGFQTPTEPPQIYAPSRLNAFRARRLAMEERNRDIDSKGISPTSSMGGSALGFARSMLGGGIQYHPDRGIVRDNEAGALVFTNVDSDDDSDEEDDMEMDHSASHSFLASLGLRPIGGTDVTRTLRAQLNELEDGDDDSDLSPGGNGDEDNHDHPRFDEIDEDDHEFHALGDADDEAQQAFGTANGTQDENPDPPADSPDPVSSPVNGLSPAGPATPHRRETPPPISLPNGDVSKPAQLLTNPGGDATPSVAKIEGLLDKSEDPIKA